MFSLFIGSILQFFVASSSPGVISPLGAQNMLARHEMSLETRYPDNFVNDVMKKNILLTLDYMGGGFTIEPGQTVSFHDIKLPKYDAATPLLSVHFSGAEGFLSDGWIVGDGVCHLASLISWVAKDAGLTVEAPTNHDFRVIPEIPKEQGVSVYSNPFQRSRSEPQNLYIKNSLSHSVEFVFDYDGEVLGISTVEGSL